MIAAAPFVVYGVARLIFLAWWKTKKDYEMRGETNGKKSKTED